MVCMFLIILSRPNTNVIIIDLLAITENYEETQINDIPWHQLDI